VEDTRVLKKLPSTLSLGSRTANSNCPCNSSSVLCSYAFVLTTSSANAEMQGTGSSIIVLHGIGIDALEIRTFVGSAITDSASSIPISVNNHYYVSLERTPTQLVLSVFSDPARTKIVRAHV